MSTRTIGFLSMYLRLRNASNQTRLKEPVQCIIFDCCEDDAFVAVFLAVTVMQMMMPIEIPKRPASHHHHSQESRTGLTTNSTFIQERQKYVRIRDLVDESVRILKYVCFFAAIANAIVAVL